MALKVHCTQHVKSFQKGTILIKLRDNSARKLHNLIIV